MVDLALTDELDSVAFSPSIFRVVKVLRILRVGRVLRLIKVSMAIVRSVLRSEDTPIIKTNQAIILLLLLA